METFVTVWQVVMMSATAVAVVVMVLFLAAMLWKLVVDD